MEVFMRPVLYLGAVLLCVLSVLAWGVCDGTCPNRNQCEPNPIGEGIDWATYNHQCNPATMTCWSYDPTADPCQKCCHFYILYCWNNFAYQFQECVFVDSTWQTCLLP
jgi:hypothetical protein